MVINDSEELEDRRSALALDLKHRGRLIVTSEMEFITGFDVSGLSGAALRDRIDIVLESLKGRGKDLAVWHPKGGLLAISRRVNDEVDVSGSNMESMIFV
jgi:hypothetical protein